MGDYIRAAGVEGTVSEIGLFATTIMTGDQVTAFVGNNKLFSENILNYTTPTRTAALIARRNLRMAWMSGTLSSVLKAAIAAIPNVNAEPAPLVDVMDFTTRGPVLAVRAYARPESYWQVFFDMNRAIMTVRRSRLSDPVEFAEPAPPPKPAQAVH